MRVMSGTTSGPPYSIPDGPGLPSDRNAHSRRGRARGCHRRRRPHPIGKRRGSLADVHPVDLSTVVLTALVERTGVDPELVDDVLWGCVNPATARVLKRSGLSVGDIGVFEVNEAFASVPPAWLAEIGADESRLNPLGGAIAVGHPLGGLGHGADDPPRAPHARPRHPLRTADDVRRWRHGERHDRRTRTLSEASTGRIVADAGQCEVGRARAHRGRGARVPGRFPGCPQEAPRLHGQAYPYERRAEGAGPGRGPRRLPHRPAPRSVLRGGARPGRALRREPVGATARAVRARPAVLVAVGHPRSVDGARIPTSPRAAVAPRSWSGRRSRAAAPASSSPP